MDKKITRSVHSYPLFFGLCGDLLFYIAIDTLFLTMVKGFSSSQVVALSSVSMVVCIVLQLPMLWVVKKLGNTWSVRLGSLFLLLSAFFITFGSNFYIILLGKLLHDISTTLKAPSVVTVKNGLDLLDRPEDYVKVRTAGNTVYSIITMIIAFIAPSMFNFNPYLPMFCCIATCTIGFAVSFFLVDYSKYDRIVIKKEDKKAKFKISYSKMIILAILLYGLFYPIVNNGQTDGKLFMQEVLTGKFGAESITNILGIVVIVSRIVRVFSNMIFVKVYKIMKSKVGVLLTVLLFSAIGLMLFGSFIPLMSVKIVIMAIGYIMILFIRDPYKIFMQDVVLNNTAKEEHQTILTLLEFAVKIGTAATGLSFAMILTKFPMAYVMAVMLVIMAVEIVFSIVLYRMILKSKATLSAE